MEKLKIGISSCLAGNNVRYNGRNKKNIYIMGTLGKWFEFYTICPEVESGMTTPREPMNLERIGSSTRLISLHSREDMTKTIDHWLLEQKKDLDGGKFDGFILQAKSPSCGIGDVKYYNLGSHKVVKKGYGLYAEFLRKNYPTIPIINAKDLESSESRSRFISNLFILKQWRKVITQEQGLKSFHLAHKYKLIAYSRVAYSKLSIIVSLKKSERFKIGLYEKYLLKLLRNGQNRSNNSYVLRQIFNEIKDLLNREEKYELLHLIELYKQGNIPLLEPITLLNHYINKQGQEELSLQTFLNPDYAELNLLNHS